MHRDHAVFVEAIHSKKILTLTFFSKEDRRQLVRTCAPMDFGPSRRSRDQSEKYHFWDYDSDEGSHVLSLLPEQIVIIAVTDKTFEPQEFVTWPPNWFLARDWGHFS